MAKKTSFDFEKTISSLTEMVNDLESGELTLEESLKKFEVGIGLTRKLQKAIEEAEQKAQQLLAENDEESPLRVEDFEEGAEDSR